MRFYGICFVIMTLLLVVLPLLPYGLGDSKQESDGKEEPLLAVVEPQSSTIKKSDVPTLAQYPLEKVK